MLVIYRVIMACGSALFGENCSVCCCLHKGYNQCVYTSDIMGYLNNTETSKTKYFSRFSSVAFINCFLPGKLFRIARFEIKLLEMLVRME